MEKISTQLKNPPKKYRSLPFWSWNSKLETQETLRQVGLMDDNGIGGFFMHARGGLKTEYMSDEWMDNVKAAVLDGNKRGMSPWGYDENGWPSGFGSDKVNSLGLDYQQKYLRFEETSEEKHTERTISNSKLPNGKNGHFYFDVNTLYVDTLDPNVTDEFIRVTHEKYKETLGKDFSKMSGFFTDEPQISRNGIPWSFTLEKEYRKAYNDELAPHLYDLFADTESSYTTRFRFWKLITRLFCENFLARIYDWCNKNDTKLTGHMVCEETLWSQMDTNGAVMPNYEYFHIPGVDKLRRAVGRDLLAPQVTSVCAQLGKKQILTESFALCGWDVSFEELKWVLEWQMVKGVNLLCQHLEGYSLEGIRKRDYPSGHFYQNPWWKQYHDFLDFAARMGMLLAEGQIRCDVLVLHNISSGWVVRGGEDFVNKVGHYTEKLTDIITAFDKNQIIHHLGDDRIMQRYGKVENSKLVVGKMSYSTVVIPGSKVIDSGTASLLEQFAQNGGKLIFVDEIPTLVDGEKSDRITKLAKIHADNADEAVKLIPSEEKYCDIVDENGNNCDIQFAVRKYDDFEMYYFVNTYSERCENVKITVNGKSACVFDYLTGENVPCTFDVSGDKLTVIHTFEKMGSYVLFVRKDNAYVSLTQKNTELSDINDKLCGEWTIEEADPNLLTLDFCDCYFDGKLFAKNIYVADIQEKACALRRKVNVKLDFTVNFAKLPDSALELVVEQPDNYTLYINDEKVEKKKNGYYRDKSFVKLDATGKFKVGENKITLVTDFVQPPEVYAQLDNCLKFESARNKLWYDMEIESIYVLGNFGVDSDKPYAPAANNSFFNDGKFSITDEPTMLCDGDFTTQRFPFFCGHMKVSKTITLSAKEAVNRKITLESRSSAVTGFTVNGKTLSNIYWAPYTADLSGLLHEGENKIELDITGNFRNMLGPHHIPYEAYSVGPSSFFHDSPIWCGQLKTRQEWSDGYSFVKYGLFLK